MNLIHFKQLLEKYTKGDLTHEEETELRSAIAGGAYHSIVEEDILQLLQRMEIHPDWTPAMEEQAWQSIVRQAQRSAEAAPVRKAFPVRQLIRWTAAAVIAGALIAATWWYMNPVPQQVAIVESKPVLQDITPPDGTHAVITLANGQEIILDSTGAGTLATQGNVQLVKLANGQIAYSGSSAEVLYNTLSNPRGSKVISLTLGDGTKIWLNSESSLRYPTAFAGNERNVEVTGEAYFEVAKDPTKKFIVSCKGIKTEVLGTHFNINAYDDEKATKVTLLEGSVKVTELKTQTSKLIKPGQQAQLQTANLSAGQAGSKLLTTSNADIEEVMAWKNGKFQFGEAMDVATVMRQLSRWYNVEVEYQRDPGGHLGGTISRNVNVSQVLKMLEMTGTIKLKMEGKKIIVM